MEKTQEYQDPNSDSDTDSNPPPTTAQHVSPLILKGKEIQKVTNYKYLGVQIDNKLQWNYQAQKAAAKRLKWVLQLNWIAKQAVSILPKLLHQLYNTVAILKMTYAVDVWYTLPRKEVHRIRKTGS